MKHPHIAEIRQRKLCSWEGIKQGKNREIEIEN